MNDVLKFLCPNFSLPMVYYQQMKLGLLFSKQKMTESKNHLENSKELLLEILRKQANLIACFQKLQS